MHNAKHTLYVLEYGDKTEKRGKWETHMVGQEIWREILKKVQIEKQTL